MTIDGRKLTHATSEEIRRMAVQRVREGEQPSAVIRSFGLCRTSIYRWLRAEKRGGPEALKASKHPGPQRKLTAKQMRQVGSFINGKDPRQFGFDFGLWTRGIVAELIESKFGMRLSLSSVGDLLFELGITPQKPLRRAYERDPEAIRVWTERTYPGLKVRAKRAGGRIFFLDEAGVRSDAVLGRTWAPRGKTPEVATSGQRQSVNAISAVSPRGEFWYQIYTERLNASAFVEFLKRFMKGRQGPIFLVLDGHPSHRAKLVQQYVASLKGKLELHFLPGYAPELNPDEFVWNHLKKQGVSKQPLRRNESLKVRVESDLQAIKRRPALLRSFFLAPSVAYTAA